VVTIQFGGGANVTEGSVAMICVDKSSETVEDFTVFISTMDGTAKNGTGQSKLMTLVRLM